MKLLGMLILACVLLSVLQAALSVLVIIGIILLIIGLFTRPAETFGFLIFGAFSTLMQAHPIGCIWLLSLMIIVALIKRKPDEAAISTHRPRALTHQSVEP